MIKTNQNEDHQSRNEISNRRQASRRHQTETLIHVDRNELDK